MIYELHEYILLNYPIDERLDVLNITVIGLLEEIVFPEKFLHLFIKLLFGRIVLCDEIPKLHGANIGISCWQSYIYEL